MIRIPHIHIALALALAFAASTLRAQNGSATAPDTTATASGLRYVITTHGNGPAPKAGSYAIVHYTGTLTDGKVFDDSRQRGTPFAFKLGAGQVIKGWDEGIALMHIGDRATLVIPANLAYGEKGAGNVIPPNSTLVFDVELLDTKDRTVGGALLEALATKGIPGMQKKYAELKKDSFNGYYLSENELNGMGYKLMNAGKTKEAAAVLKINVDAFPESANVYDSYGEACMKNGDRRLAIVNYQRSLELDGNNKNAQEMLDKLKGTK